MKDIKNIPKLENWELVRDFEIESLNLNYRVDRRNNVLVNSASTAEEMKKAQEKLDAQQNVFNSYRDEILKRMK